MLSVLSTAEVDGAKLTDEDLLNFAFLLLVAGNETTRNLIALGTLALIEHPDECAEARRGPHADPGAVEEMLRWTSPVTHMARAATADVEIRGQLIREGDTVVMLYGSANRDEEIFGSDAEEFKIDRHPNPHIAFGCGEHSCVGAQLARLEASRLLRGVARAISQARTGRRRRPDAGDDGARRQAHARAIGNGELAMYLDFTPEQKELRAEIRASLESGDDARAHRRGRRPHGGRRRRQGMRAARSAPPTCSASAGPKNMADGASPRSSSSSSSKRHSGSTRPSRWSRSTPSDPRSWCTAPTSRRRSSCPRS